MLLPLVIAACGLFGGPAAPSPFRGAQNAAFALRCEGDARAAVAGRLAALGLEAALAPDPGDRLRVAVEGADRLDDLAGLLTAPRDLALIAVAADQSPVLPLHDRVEEAALAPLSDPASGPEGAFALDAAEALIEATGGPLPPVAGVLVAERGDERVFAAPRAADWDPWLQTLALPAGSRAALECWREPDEQRCTPVLLEGAPLVTVEHIAATSMQVVHPADPPVLELVFDPTGSHAFAEATARLLGRRIALVSGGEVVSAPVVREATSGGRIVIDAGRDPDGEATLWRIHALIASPTPPGRCVLLP